MSEVKLTNTPYDDVFRTLLNDCSSLIIPVINEVFHERYSGKEKVVFSANEHFLNRQGGNEDERITDSNFKIVGTKIKKYHLECQSTIDNSILVRMFEYGTQIALDEGEIKENVLTVTFPHSAVLYLRCNESTPDKMKIKMVTPGGEVAYDIPLMKSQQYTIDEIFEKRLLFLIPFYIFSHEKRFEEYEKDGTKLKLLQGEYELIKSRLEELMDQGEISEYMKCTINDMSNKVLEHIAVKYDSVKKGVQSVMGGKILEYEAKTIRNEGMEEGMEKGINALVSTLKDMNVPIQTILEKVQEKFNLSLETAKKYI
ncbi:hypothetical protein C818_02093 [Lachnospiraceae bacterium MD308]|nr:hypothetical protein C818_02093 [Lachnospiraceae bacterium MD308]